jgi:hypothetical protein
MPLDVGPVFADDGLSACAATGPCSTPAPALQACYGPPWIWGRAEYLVWWTDGMDLPPLVTTSPNGTLKEQAGVLGQPDTSILFGDSRLNNEARSGGRFTLGLWLDPCRSRGVEASYMVLDEETEQFDVSSTGDPILARPFFNTATNAQDALLVAFNGVDAQGNPYQREGSILATADTRFQGFEFLFRRSLQQRCENRLDFLLGYRFNRLDDELRIGTDFTVIQDPNPLLVGTRVKLFDLFETRNDFHGAQLGLVFRERLARWSLEMLIKLGLGNTHSEVVIDGSMIHPARSPGGLLAQQSNIGAYERDDFAVIPELGLTLGYNITPCLRATFGYTFIYWSKVARPGDQIDLNVSLPTFPPAPAGDRPEFSWATTDFWAQGLNVGLDYRF